MTQRKKYLLGGTAAVVIALGLAVAVVIGNLGRIIKYGVEHYGSEATGTAVTVNDVEVSIFSGAGELRGFEIRNPKGYETDAAFRIAAGDIAVDTKTLADDTVIVRYLTVDAAHLTAEFQTATQCNLNVILDHLQRYAAQQPATEETAIKLIVDRFVFRNGELRVLYREMDVDQTIPIPDVVVNGIGRKSAGVTAAEAGLQLLQPVIRQALAAARDELVRRGRQKLGEKIKRTARKIGDKIGRLFSGGADDEDGG